jgi:hypothetical protein
METDGTLGVELDPHGIQFNRPVTMTVDLQGTSAEGQSESSTTLWFNEDQGWWEAMPRIETYNPNDLSTTLEHFSHYGSSVGG